MTSTFAPCFASTSCLREGSAPWLIEEDRGSPSGSCTALTAVTLPPALVACTCTAPKRVSPGAPVKVPSLAVEDEPPPEEDEDEPSEVELVPPLVEPEPPPAIPDARVPAGSSGL